MGRLFLLMIAGSILRGIVAFTGTMFYVGIADSYRLVVGAWGFTILILLTLGWLAGRLRRDARSESLDPKSSHKQAALPHNGSDCSKAAASSDTARGRNRRR